MKSQANGKLEDQNRAAASYLSKIQTNSGPALQFLDNRPESTAQRKLQEKADNGPQAMRYRAIRELISRRISKVEQIPGIKEAGNLSLKFANNTAPVQRVPVSASNMGILFPGGRKGREWFFWGRGGYHVGAIRESDGTGEVPEFHVKKDFKGGKTNRIDWSASGETYNEVEPPTSLAHDDEDALYSMRSLGEETKDLLIKWKK